VDATVTAQLVDAAQDLGVVALMRAQVAQHGDEHASTISSEKNKNSFFN